jgi:hypothetical protein
VNKEMKLGVLKAGNFLYRRTKLYKVRYMSVRIQIQIWTMMRNVGLTLNETQLSWLKR